MGQAAYAFNAGLNIMGSVRPSVEVVAAGCKAEVIVSLAIEGNSNLKRLSNGEKEEVCVV